MVYNAELGREIPASWEAGNLNVIAEYINGLLCQRFRPQKNEDSLPVVKIREIHEGIQADTERVSANILGENIIEDDVILFSWAATLEVNYWIGGKAGLNQHIFKVLPNDGFNREYVYHQRREYVSILSKLRKRERQRWDTSRRITRISTAFQYRRPLCCRVFKQKCAHCTKNDSKQIVTLRDWLLPMLMNGQVGFIYSFSIQKGVLC